MTRSDTIRPRGDVSFKPADIALAVMTKTCGQCLKPKSVSGGRIGYVRGLVKKAFICAQCSGRMAK